MSHVVYLVNILISILYVLLLAAQTIFWKRCLLPTFFSINLFCWFVETNQNYVLFLNYFPINTRFTQYNVLPRCGSSELLFICSLEMRSERKIWCALVFFKLLIAVNRFHRCWEATLFNPFLRHYILQTRNILLHKVWSITKLESVFSYVICLPNFLSMNTFLSDWCFSPLASSLILFNVTADCVRGIVSMKFCYFIFMIFIK